MHGIGYVAGIAETAITHLADRIIFTPALNHRAIHRGHQAGAVAAMLGTPALLVVLAAVAALVLSGYHVSRQQDPGLTGEVAMLVTVLLGALAMQAHALAAALGVVVAVLLWAKAPLHRISHELVSEAEVQDALLLAAAALVVLPLLPEEAVDPWGVLQPAMLWKIVVLIMATGMLGHVARRAVGARRG